MDDITPDMDWDKFNMFINLFRKYKVKPLLGIVPSNKDPNLCKQASQEDFWNVMRNMQKQGIVEFAQHGFEHLYVTKDAGIMRKYGFFAQSEFAGLPYEEQYLKIKSGREILEKEGIKTDIWMAPSHTIDFNTIRALKELGFKMVTDGIALYPYYFQGLLFIPQQMWRCEYLPIGIGTVCLHTNDLNESFLKDIENCLIKGLPTIAFSSLSEVRVTTVQKFMNVIFKRYYISRNIFWKLKGRIKGRIVA